MNEAKISSNHNPAFLLIDIQNDFVNSGKNIINGKEVSYNQGSLGVHEGHAIVPEVNRMMNLFSTILASQDWHPKNHGSFASTHNLKPFIDKGPLTGCPDLWPDHCIQETDGAAFLDGLEIEKVERIFKKGLKKEIDSYSAFFDVNGNNPSGLDAYLKSQGKDSVVIAGIATDYCVKFSALDAKALGYDVIVLIDLCRGVSQETTEKAIEEMKAKDIKVITSEEYKHLLLGSLK